MAPPRRREMKADALWSLQVVCCGVRRVGDASYSIASRKILDQRVANLEKRCDCKGKGCQTADHMTVSASLFVRRSGSFSEEPGAPSVGGEEKIPRRCLVILPGKVDDHRVAVQVQGEYQD